MERARRKKYQKNYLELIAAKAKYLSAWNENIEVCEEVIKIHSEIEKLVSSSKDKCCDRGI